MPVAISGKRKCRLRVGLGRRGFFLASLQAGIASIGKLLLELFDASGRVDKFQLAGIERMANVADVDLQLFSRAARREGITATTLDVGFVVFGMNASFHDGCSLPKTLTEARLTKAARQRLGEPGFCQTIDSNAAEPGRQAEREEVRGRNVGEIGCGGEGG